jgi:cAMP-dependent protein kinase regulator
MLTFGKAKFEHLDRYLANKDYDKALKAVASEIEKNPAHFNLLLRQAEILGLAGDRAKAVAVYRQLAERYAGDGFYAKAIALYKKVLRLDPNLEEVDAELARLIEADRKIREPLDLRLDDQQTAETQDTTPGGDTTDSTVKEIQASKLFAQFPEGALEKILSSTALRSYSEGDIIVTEGEEGSSLFLIVSGEVKVFTRSPDGRHLPLAELGAGDFFGEVSLLTGKPRTATITARSPVTAIELNKRSIDDIASDFPEVRQVIESFYERRAHDTVEAVIRRMRGST